MILLTGSSGFLGSNLFNEIARRGKPICKYSSSAKSLSSNLMDPLALRETREVLLCGGYVNHGNSLSKDTDGVKRSWDVINSILNIKFSNLRRITYFSTTDVYPAAVGILETDSPYPTNEYTETKLLQEIFLRGFCDNEGVGFQILRVGNVYGPGEHFRKKLIPTLIKSAIEKKVFSQRTDHNYLVQPLYVDDLTRIVLNILDRGNTEELLNVVNPTLVSVGNLIEIVNSALSLEVELSIDNTIPPRTFNTSKLEKFTPADLTPIEIGIKNEIEYEIERLNNR